MTKLVKLLLIQHKQSIGIGTNKTGGQSYRDTSPYLAFDKNIVDITIDIPKTYGMPSGYTTIIIEGSIRTYVRTRYDPAVFYASRALNYFYKMKRWQGHNTEF